MRGGQAWRRRPGRFSATRQTGPVAGSKHDQIRARRAPEGCPPDGGCPPERRACFFLLSPLASPHLVSSRMVARATPRGPDVPPGLHGIEYGRRSFSGSTDGLASDRMRGRQPCGPCRCTLVGGSVEREPDARGTGPGEQDGNDGHRHGTLGCADACLPPYVLLRSGAREAQIMSIVDGWLGRASSQRVAVAWHGVCDGWVGGCHCRLHDATQIIMVLEGRRHVEGGCTFGGRAIAKKYLVRTCIHG